MQKPQLPRCILLQKVTKKSVNVNMHMIKAQKNHHHLWFDLTRGNMKSCDLFFRGHAAVRLAGGNSAAVMFYS